MRHWGLFWFLTLGWTGVAWADEPIFAVIVGVNQSVDPELAPLRYADDDAVRYQDLFQLLGARTWLMARLDANTTRLHPGRAAVLPVDAALDPLIHEVGQALLQARAGGAKPVLYVVYSGHGNQEDGRGYLTLEDVRLDANALSRRIFARLEAEQTHFIVDACYSSFLALARGPGGVHRETSGYSDASLLGGGGRVGLLLSTSSARESHEWEAFQAGVFSHEVRSGLYGAADADGDHQIGYGELAAFVDRANAAIPNEKYRPDLYAQAPRSTEVFLDLRRASPRRLVVEGKESAHYFLEDQNGVRLADFHPGPTQTLELLRPPGPLYVHRLRDDREFAVPDAPGRLTLAALDARAPRSATRGAAHEAFSRTFALAFDREVVFAYRGRPLELSAPLPAAAWPRPVAIGALTAGGLSLAASLTFTILAHQTSSGLAADATQDEAAGANARIDALNTGLVISGVAGGVLVLAGALLLGLDDGDEVEVGGPP